MDVREKLVELINDCRVMEGYGMDLVEKQADYLISNGVTVQDWVSVDDKYPPYNRDVVVYRPNMAMKIIVDTYDGYYGDDDKKR